MAYLTGRYHALYAEYAAVADDVASLEREPLLRSEPGCGGERNDGPVRRAELEKQAQEKAERAKNAAHVVTMGDVRLLTEPLPPPSLQAAYDTVVREGGRLELVLRAMRRGNWGVRKFRAPKSTPRLLSVKKAPPGRTAPFRATQRVLRPFTRVPAGYRSLRFLGAHGTCLESSVEGC